MTERDGPGLFDAPVGGIQRVFLATNRHNVLKALATRTLAPLAGYADKYYEDLLRFAPGRIPLLADGVGPDVAALVIAGEFDFPVLVEVDSAALADRDVAAFGSTPGRARVGADRWRAWAPAGPLPFHVVSAIHFRSSNDLTEFSLNDYADVRPVPQLMRVSADLFTSELAASDLTDWLGSLEVPSTVPAEALIDRRGGALLMGASAVAEDQVDAIVSLINRTAFSPVSPAVAGLASWVAGLEIPRDGPERVSAWVIADELALVDRNKVWRPPEIVEAVRHRIATTGLTNEQLETISAVLDRTGAILRSEVAFERLRSGGSSSLKALLCVLMRPEPERFASWDLEEAGADDDVQFTATALLGSLTGRARVPTSMRPPVLDDLIASWECVGVAGPDNVAPPVPTVVRDKRDGAVIVHIDGNPTPVIRATTRRRPKTLVEAGDEHEIPTAPKSGISASQVALALGSSEAMAMAVSSSEKAGLGDAITTTVRGASRTSRTEIDHDGILTITFRGSVTVERSVAPEAFIAAIQGGQIPADEVRDLVEPPPQIPQATATSKPRARRRKVSTRPDQTENAG
jgi:hypothetical protein